MTDLSDTKIRAILKSHGKDCGPITPQTKSVYLNQIKKLQGNRSNQITNDNIPIKAPRHSEPIINNYNDRRDFMSSYDKGKNKVTDNFVRPPNVQPVVSPISYSHRNNLSRYTDSSHTTNLAKNVPKDGTHWYNGSLRHFSKYLGAKDHDLLDISDVDISDSENTVFKRFRNNYKTSIPIERKSPTPAPGWLASIDCSHLPNILLFLVILIVVGAFGTYLTFKTRYSHFELDVAMEKLVCHDSQDSVCFSETELVRLRPSLQRLYGVLCEHAGHNLYQGSSDKRMSFQNARQYLNYGIKQAQQDPMSDGDWSRLMTLVVYLPDNLLHIAAYDQDNELLDESSYKYSEDVTFLECLRPKCSLLCRMKLTMVALMNWVWYIIYTIILTGAMLLFGYLVYLYRRRRRAAHEQRIEELRNVLSDICEILEDQLHRSESSTNVDSFVSLDKIRVMLQQKYPRLRDNLLWDKIKDFAFKNEPRIHMRETLTHGICLQWRGSSAVHNGKEVSFVNGPTECIKIRNIVVDKVNYDWEEQLRSELNGCLVEIDGIKHMGFINNGSKVLAYVMCANREVSGQAFAKINGNYFQGNLLDVKFIRLDKYEARFPESCSFVK